MAEPVTITYDDLFERFAAETATITRRAVMAEAKADAFEKACAEKDAIIDVLAARMAEHGVPLPSEDGEQPAPANRATRRATAKKATPKKKRAVAAVPAPE